MTINSIEFITQMPSDQFYYIAMIAIGQLSFIFAAWSFVKKDMLELRRFQVISGTLGLVFNSYLAFGQDTVSWGLVTVVFWLSVFLLINLIAERRLNAARMEVALSSDDKTLFANALPLATTRDIKNLLQSAETLRLDDKYTVLARKEQTNRLFLIREGQILESLPSGERWLLGRGMMLGDITFLINDACHGSEGDLTVDGSVVVLTWTYSELHGICSISETLHRALTDGIARGLARKRNYLNGTNRFGGSLEKLEPRLNTLQRDIHAEVLADLSVAEFKVLMDLADIKIVKSGEQIELNNELACIENGKVSVCLMGENRSENLISQYGLLGEFGIIAPDRRNRTNNELIALESTTLLIWSRESLDDIEMNAPKLYISLMKCIARSLVLKLASRGFNRPDQ